MWLLAAAVASLAVVVPGTGAVQQPAKRNRRRLRLLSVLNVALSWSLVNTVYAFKYARLYYLDEPDIGGIDFKQEDPPDVQRLRVPAFTVGMSFAVSRNGADFQSHQEGRAWSRLLSYTFGTGILAVAINLVTNLGQ